jgi:hypothetical protein
MKKRICLLLTLAWLVPPGQVVAQLIDNGDGTITDVDVGLMWTAAAIPKTATWEGAMAWAGGLTLGGFTDWRLPSGYNIDGSGFCDHNLWCFDSEMGHLYHGELGPLDGQCCTGPSQLTPPMTFMPDGRYWLLEEEDADHAWRFFVSYDGIGGQDTIDKSVTHWALAVREIDPVEGACCFLDESCLVLTQDDCNTQGGAYHGPYTVCDPNPCLTGACCFSGAACQELSPADCASQGGDYQGDGTDCTVGVPGDFATIQAAINIVCDGGEVVVADGIYTGVGNKNLGFGGKEITVRSASGDPSLCIIDCEGGGRGFVFQSGELPAAVVSGFTIKGAGVGTGGGMRCTAGSPTIINCIFLDNNASIEGGGMDVSAGSPTLINCQFIGNSGQWGGGFNSSAFSSTLINCTFIGNDASVEGGGLRLEGAGIVAINCTFSGNTSPAGGAVYCNGAVNGTLTNCILWGNSDSIGGNTSGLSVTFSDVEGGFVGTGNIDTDPLFLDAAGGDLRLGACSLAVDAGDNDAVPVGTTTDLDGNARFVDDAGVIDSGNGTPPVVDMGAYERQMDSVPAVVGVPGDFATIQAAINASCDGGEVVVADGTHTGVGNKDLDLGGKAITVRSASGNPSLCIIDCEGSGRGFNFQSGETAEAKVIGFTITGGAASGGGIRCNSAAPTIVNCVFDANDGIGSGGGVRNKEGDPTFVNCRFIGNDAVRGGGIFSDKGNVTLINCTFLANDAPKGGGLYVKGTPGLVTVTNCTMSGNTSLDGGAIYSDSAFTGIVTNSILWGNDSSIEGDTSGFSVTFSDVEGGFLGTGNIDTDPMFIDPGDVHLLPGSLCIDAGENATVPVGITTDLDGNPRFIDDPASPDCWQAPGTCGDPPIVDMGAYEFRLSPPNNDPNNPEPVNSGDTIADDFANATSEGTSSCDPESVDLFYEVTITTGPATLEVDTCGSVADAALAVFDSSMIELGCNTDCGGTPCGAPDACLTLPGLPADSYLIRVSQQTTAGAGGSGTSFTLTVFVNNCPCDCALPSDGTVNVVDFLALLGEWGGAGPCDCAGGGDGVVNVVDFLAMLGAWGSCPE